MIDETIKISNRNLRNVNHSKPIPDVFSGLKNTEIAREEIAELKTISFRMIRW